MAVSDWVADTRRNIREGGVTHGMRHAARDAWPGLWRRAGQYVNYGATHWERDWDVLIMLDACRVDVMQEVATETEFLPDDIPSVYSAASMSHEWIEKHTQPEYRDNMAETALISANPHTRFDCVRDKDWTAVDEVWRHSWDDDVGTVPPRGVTDAAIRHARQDEAGKLIAWYMQPHQPFIGAEWSKGYDSETFGEGGNHGKCVWRQCRDGEVDAAELWSAYRRTLKWVLEDVAVLLENIDGTVVITADHANCLGEWGIYGHPRNAPVPTLKRVPWVELDATDTESHTPPAEPAARAADDVVTDRLRNLGYR